jgi:hypothetical protein
LIKRYALLVIKQFILDECRKSCFSKEAGDGAMTLKEAGDGAMGLT